MRITRATSWCSTWILTINNPIQQTHSPTLQQRWRCASPPRDGMATMTDATPTRVTTDQAPVRPSRKTKPGPGQLAVSFIQRKRRCPNHEPAAALQSEIVAVPDPGKVVPLPGANEGTITDIVMCNRRKCFVYQVRGGQWFYKKDLGIGANDRIREYKSQNPDRVRNRKQVNTAGVSQRSAGTQFAVSHDLERCVA